MRVLVQRVRSATVRVGGEVVGAIDGGLLAFVGVAHGDTDEVARWLAGRTARLRVFADADVAQREVGAAVGGAVLVVSQFTLYADTQKGNRPSFVRAADPELASRLVDVYRQALEDEGVPTAAGVFGAMMDVELVNDGPFTVMLEREAVLG